MKHPIVQRIRERGIPEGVRTHISWHPGTEGLSCDELRALLSREFPRHQFVVKDMTDAEPQDWTKAQANELPPVSGEPIEGLDTNVDLSEMRRPRVLHVLKEEP